MHLQLLHFSELLFCNSVIKHVLQRAVTTKHHASHEFYWYMLEMQGETCGIATLLHKCVHLVDPSLLCNVHVADVQTS